MECTESKTILVIEDDKSVQDMLKDVLEIEGFNIVTASDGAEGIEKLKGLRGQSCVILLDLMMPGTNGWQFLDFQRSDPELSSNPVIVCSAYSESAKSVRPNAVVMKPVRLDTLLETVNAFCA